ncbi:hypothetical protein [Nocardia sp. NPDC052566]|uniref:hypothetical protein n=1 Tax=Nocardia sp. NPDC052566 TaxID=3364330 RepID=UPI0037C73D2A
MPEVAKTGDIAIDCQRFATSSIGAVWPPILATHNRLRGFYPAIVDTPYRMRRFVREFTDYQQRAKTSGVDRLSIKYVGIAESVPRARDNGIHIEGMIPLATTDSRYLIYARWNSPARTPGTEDLDRHRMLLERTRAQPRRETSTDCAVRALGLDLRLLSRTTPPHWREREIPRFSEVYRAFDLGESATRELILDVNNTIAYLVAPDGGVVCTAVGEHARIPIAGHGIVALCEITEGTTRADHRGRGLYRGLSALLVDLLRQEPLDAIYGECNLSAPGVVHAARQNNRRFVYDDRNRYGTAQPDFGILCRNAEIGETPGEYQDFALTYIDLS